MVSTALECLLKSVTTTKQVYSIGSNVIHSPLMTRVYTLLRDTMTTNNTPLNQLVAQLSYVYYQHSHEEEYLEQCLAIQRTCLK